MGSLNLICPMCCGESFNNPQSLKYHLLSITDNLYCPGCSQRSDSVLALIQHLERCGQSPEPESNPLIETNVEQINQTFLATVNDDGIMIVEDSRDIQVGDNGEINVVDKMDVMEESAQILNSEAKDCQTSVPPVADSIDGSSNPVPLVELAKDDTEDMEDKNASTIVPSRDGFLGESAGNLIDGSHDLIQHVDEVHNLNESGLLGIKEELCEVKLEELEADALYSCSSCGMSFNSVLEHIKQYHDGQEVVLEMAEQQLEIQPAPPVSPPIEEPPSVVTNRQRQMMNTLRTEECVDSEGRLYTRKVVQIERFWDHPPSSSLPSTKAPMIEKFFSNVEGVKVREKNLPSGPTRMYRCNHCLEHFAKLADFRVHVCVHGNNQCGHCDQAFATARALQHHMKVHELDEAGVQRSFVCATCGTEFSSHKSLRLHSRMHAPVRARHVDAPEGTHNATFTCPECGKTLSESYRSTHMALHSGGSVTCTICNRKFDSSDSLAMHAAVHTELSQSHSPTPPRNEGNETVDAQKPYQCQHCGRRFARPHEKVKHERIHTGEKPHACEVCGKTFRVSYCLTLHMRTHTGVRPYVCQHCGKRFKASSVYNHHLLTHGEERAYTCPYCPKTFKTRVQLAGHKNSHTKPFRCTECSRPFASLYAARAHIQTHKKDNNLKFSCYICGASYGRAFALKDHLKQHGQDVLAPPEPAREEEIHEGNDFLLVEEEAEDDELIIPSPAPVAHSSEAEESD